MERNTSQGFEIKCDAKKCRRCVVTNFDPILGGKNLARNKAMKIGYVKKGEYWLCGEHKDMTTEDIDKQYDKKKDDDE